MTDTPQMPPNLDKTPADHSPFGPKPPGLAETLTRSLTAEEVKATVRPVVRPLHPIVTLLLELPADIKKKQEIFDNADTVYQGVLATVTLKAYSEALFPGKKDGEPKRAASNDDERKAAVAILTTGDSTLAKHAEERERALRELQEAKNKFEGAKLAAALLARADQ